MSTRGKIITIILLSIVLVICIVFAVVLTLQRGNTGTLTEQTQEESESPTENDDLTWEPAVLEDVPSEYEKNTEEIISQPVEENCQPTSLVDPSEPAAKPDKGDNNTKKETEPQKESEATQPEETSPTDDTTEPAVQVPTGIPGNGEWGGGEFEN